MGRRQLDFERLLVIGPAGAGKTTLIEGLCLHFGLSYFDVRNLVLDVIHATGENDIGDRLKEIYYTLLNRLPNLETDILEISNDWPEIFFDPIVNVFFGKQRGLIIYVSCPRELCTIRVQEREFPTPDYRIGHHFLYDFSYFENRAMKLNAPIVEYHGNRDSETEFSSLVDQCLF